MVSKISFLMLLSPLLSLLVVAADLNLAARHDTPVGSAWSRRHARTAPGVSKKQERHLPAVEIGAGLQKRFDGARFTYYDAGQGACGRVNTNADYIVAMNSAQFAGGAHCFETITIAVNGKTAQAAVADECPSCPFGGLDFSRGLFNYFASESAGVITGQWIFGMPIAPTPTPSPTPSPSPPTSIVPPPTSSTPTPSSSSLVPSSSSGPASSSSSAGSSVPSGLMVGGQSVPIAPQGNLEMTQVVFIEIGAAALSAISV